MDEVWCGTQIDLPPYGSLRESATVIISDLGFGKFACTIRSSYTNDRLTSYLLSRPPLLLAGWK